MSPKASFISYLEKVIKDHKLFEDIALISSYFKPLDLSKNKYLVKAGGICPYFCFIEKGVLQHSIVVSGDEKTTYLALKENCTVALNSFKNKEISRKSIKAISDCKLLVINRNDFMKLLDTNSGFQAFYHNLIENQIFLIDDYRINLLTLSPEERYHNLLNTDPNILQQVPLHYLASFLGISNRHMSRIRKNKI